jgi:uncharacterized protein
MTLPEQVEHGHAFQLPSDVEVMSTPIHFLYRIRPTRAGMLSEGPTEHESEVVAEHFAYLERLQRAGVVLMAGRTLTADKEAFGVVVFTAQSHAAATAIMNDDPAVERGVMQAKLFPFRVALWSGKVE